MSNNIIIGQKGGNKPGYYESAIDVLDRLNKFKSGWFLGFGSKYIPTNEKLKRSFYYVTREHAENLVNFYEQCDWASIKNLPRQKDGTAYQLKIDYVPSGKFIGIQIIEARTGSDGGYFNISPPILYFDEEAIKIFPDIKQLL